MEEEMFVEFRDMDAIKDAGERGESVEHEGLFGEGLMEAEVEHKVEEEALVEETLSTGSQTS